MNRWYTAVWLALAAVAGCATSDGRSDVDGSVGGTADAAELPDAPVSSIDAPAAPDAADSPDAPVVMIDAAPGTPDADPPDADPPDADPPDADPPDAMPPDAMPDACVPAWTNLLSNGDFEAGATVWSQVGGTIIRQYGAGYPWPAQSGTWAALFGGANDTAHQLSQSVAVPASATDLRLRGYLCFVTEEITTLTEYDTVTVQIQGPASTEEYTWSNLDAGTTCAWTSFTLTTPEVHAGETVTLAFINDNDFSNITSFGFDTLLLEAFYCP